MGLPLIFNIETGWEYGMQDGPGEAAVDAVQQVQDGLAVDFQY